jgi:AsmA-like C-terminal region/AsmA family/Protein of unknown function
MSLRLPANPVFRVAIFAAAGVVVLFAAAWAAIAIFLPPSKLRPMIERRMTAALARDVRFADAHAGLWPPIRITVTGVALAEPGGFEQGAMFQAKAIHFDLNVPALLGRRVLVQRLVLDEPAVHVVLRADGTTNFDGLGEGPEGEAAERAEARARQPMDLGIEDFQIHGGRVLFDDIQAHRRIAFGIGTRTSLGLAGVRVRTQGKTEIDGLAFGPDTASRVEDLNQSLAPLEWRIEHRGAYDLKLEKLALETLGLRFGDTQLAVTGVVDESGPETVVDLRTSGSNLDLGDILSFLSAAQSGPLEGLEGDGALGFDLAVRGPLGGRTKGSAPGDSAIQLPDVTGTVTLANTWVQLDGAPAKIENLSLTAQLTPDAMSIPDLRAQVAGQPLRGTLAVREFTDPRVAFHIQGDVDLAAVAPLFAPKDSKLSGRAALDVRGNGHAKRPEAMMLEGRARLAGVRIEQPALPRPVEKISGDIEFSQTRARVSGLTAQAGPSSFKLDATVDRPLALTTRPGDPDPPTPATLNFTFVSPHLDMADFTKGGGGGPVPLHANGTGRISIGKLKSGKVEMDRVSADVTLHPMVLAAPSFRGDIYGGRLAGSAMFDMRDPKHPRVALISKLDSARVERLLGTWVPPGEWLQGVLGTTLDVEGDLSDVRNSMTAKGLAAVWNGTVANPVLDAVASFTKVPSLARVKFDDLKSTFRVQDGRVMTGPARLSGPAGDWILSGSVGLDGSLDYAAGITLPASVAGQLGGNAALAAGAMADDQGRILLDLRIGGTTKNPKISWDSKATGERMRGKLSSALEEQLEKLKRQSQDTAAALQRTGGDSARAMARLRQKRLEDSLLNQAGKLLEGFFGKGKRDTTR